MRKWFLNKWIPSKSTDHFKKIGLQNPSDRKCKRNWSDWFRSPPGLIHAANFRLYTLPKPWVNPWTDQNMEKVQLQFNSMWTLFTNSKLWQDRSSLDQAVNPFTDTFLFELLYFYVIFCIISLPVLQILLNQINPKVNQSCLDGLIDFDGNFADIK